MNPYDRVTDEVKDVIRRASTWAMEFGSEFVNAEHILLALHGDGDGSTAKALRSLGIEYDSLLTEVRSLMTAVAELPPRMEMKRVIDSALGEAEVLAHRAVRCEHLLLGIARLNGSIAVQVLNNLGADSDQVRTAVLRILAQPES
jgi:ATP-dependent Clp protease ATP-binding subunit ClpA